MSASETTLRGLPSAAQAAPGRAIRTQRLDAGFLAGLAISAVAAVAGIATTGVGLSYFLQPAGALIVLGGTLGVVFLTTPISGLLHTVRRVRELFSADPADREALIGQIVRSAVEARYTVLLKMEPEIRRIENAFLREGLLLAMDVKNRAELQAALETEIRMRERQGEADARVLEVAGGFAPTLGILGTVVGLVDVLRQFSSVQSVYGVGMAFVSTLYGLGLANLVLLPAAQRIRARASEDIEIHELIADGVLCVFDQVHPYLIRQRLRSFLRPEERDSTAPRPAVT
ncbi:MAG: MotA/TolQ/ExbB proton channel family protein [Bryobacteraceae bacterium]